MMKISAKGGGDTPEDWKGAYDIALDKRLDKDKMNWRRKSIKVIIHIADAGAHTLRFSDGDNKHNDFGDEIGLVENIKSCAKQKINIFAYQIGSHPKKSFSECKSIYDSVGAKDCNYEIYKFKHASDKEVADKLKDNITNHISAFIAKK